MNDLLHSPTLIGHDESLKQIINAFDSGRMPHAWLITGVEGIGKTTLAYHIAHHALSSGKNCVGNIDINHPVAKLIYAEAHPDMLVVRRSPDHKTGEMRNVIVIEDALSVASFLHKTSSHGGWRIVIIDEAHHLNRSSMNALLKIIEEPPPSTLILITATTPGVLLPTLRSRCRLLPLLPLQENNLRLVLMRHQPDLDEATLKQLIDRSGGSVGFALKVLKSETLPLLGDVLDILNSRPHFDVVRLHKLADQISRKADQESFNTLTSLLIEHLRGIVYNQALADLKLGQLGLKIELWDKARSDLSLAMTSNLDRKLAFINVLTSLRSSL